MRVLVLTTSFPRDADDASGHFVRAAALRLQAAGDDVHVVAPGGSAFATPERRDGLTLHHAGGGSVFAWPGAIARLVEAPWRLPGVLSFTAGALARVRSLGRVDRAVAHWIVPCAFPLAAAVRAPLEVVAHGADVRLLVALPPAARERVLDDLLARDARFTFAASSLLTALERSVGPRVASRLAARAHVEPPAIDVPDVASRAAELRAALAMAEDERLVVTVCRLIRTKRVELAIDAVRAVNASRASPARARLVVVGDGPERPALAERAGDLASAVVFTGALPRREALAWVAASDALLHPSAVEAAPSVVREARALGVVVVACDAGDVAAWARDDARIRIADPSAAGLADALADALSG